jgi:hypothetical protein
VNGGWYAARDAAKRPSGYPLDDLLKRYFEGRVVSEEGRAAVARLDAALDEERRGRAAESSGPWARFDRLVERLELAPEEADLLLLLFAPAMDPETRWMLRLLDPGPDEPGLSAELAADLLDPMAKAREVVARALGASGRLAQLGLVVRLGARLVAAEPLMEHLIEGAAPLPATAAWLDPAGCKSLAARAERHLARTITALEVGLASTRTVSLVGGPGQGAAWLAAWVAARSGVGLIRVSASSPAVLGPILALEPAVLLVDVVGELGAWAALAARHAAPALLLRVSARQAPAGVQMVRLPELAISARAALWRDALEPIRPYLDGDVRALPDRLAAYRLGPDQIDEALRLGLVLSPHDVRAGLEAACRQVRGSHLDELSPRLPPPLGATPLGARERLATAFADRAPDHPLVITLEPSAAEPRTVGAQLASELGLELHHLRAERLLIASPDDGRRWLAELIAAVAAEGAALFVDGVETLHERAPESMRLLATALMLSAAILFVPQTDSRLLFGFDSDPSPFALWHAGKVERPGTVGNP